MNHIYRLAVVLLFGLAGLAEADEKPHAVFVIGTHHYAPEKSMPQLAKTLEDFGFRTTVLIPEGNPEKNKNKVGLPGLEVLKEADVAIFFLRFLTLNDEQFAPIQSYIESGKPVVGFRTSTHAFAYPKDHPRAKWNLDFGRYVLGTKYIVHQSGPTEAQVIGKHKNHPILSGVGPDPFTSPGTLYLTSLQPGCVPLVMGTGMRKGDRLVEGAFGTFWIQEQEKDIVAWAWINQWNAKVFCSSFGHVGDFKEPTIMRIIVNGICWAAGQPVPASDAEIPTFDIPNPKKK